MVTAECEDEGFEPAPDGLPAGVAVGLSTEEATKAGESSHEFSHGADRSWPTCDLTKYFHPFQRHQFFGLSLRSLTSGNSAFVTRVSSRLDARAGGVSFLRLLPVIVSFEEF